MATRAELTREWRGLTPLSGSLTHRSGSRLFLCGSSVEFEKLGLTLL